MPISLKSTISSLRSARSSAMVLSFTSKFSFRFSNPRSIRDFHPLLPKHFKVFLYRVQLFPQDSLTPVPPRIEVSRISKLFVRQDDHSAVVVLDVVEDTLAVLLRKVILPRVKHLSIGVSFPKGVRNVKDISLSVQ